jgi:hypothetical protein
VCVLLPNIGFTQDKPEQSIPEPEAAKVKVLTDLQQALATANETEKPVFVYVFDSA